MTTIKAIFILLCTCIFLSCKDTPPPSPIYPIPTQAQIDWQKLETYAFIHYGLCTYTNSEWGFGDVNPDKFNPSNLDVDQWISTLKNAGMKGVLFTIKHHDGFGLWPSKYGEYNISKSPYADGQADLLREVVNACKKYDLKLALYISPWDRNHAEYGNTAYAEYFQNQISEVIDEYCNDIELFEFWFDGANGGDGYYGGARDIRNIDPATYYQYEKAAEKIHSKFPNAMIFGGTVPTIRWVGNESGWAGETNWSMYEEELKRRHANAMWGDLEGQEWLPAEVDVSIRPGWFFHERESHQLRSIGTLVDYYYQSVGRNANLLLNVPINLEGRIASADSARIIEWKKVIDSHFDVDLVKNAQVKGSSSRGRTYKAANINDSNWDSFWVPDNKDNKMSLVVNFDNPTEVNTLLLQEYIPLGQRVAEFKVEYQNDHGEFTPIITTDSMTTIGYKRLIRFENTKTSALKVSFEKARDVPCINNISAYLTPAVLDEPSISRDQNGMVYIKGSKGALIYYTIDGTEPSINSNLYKEPFCVLSKASIKALTYDPTTKEISSVKSEEFDILTSKFFIVSPQTDSNNKNAFDGNINSSYYLPENTKSFTFSFGDSYNVKGLMYTPDQSRWGTGPIHRYRIWIDNTFVKEGEFSNIKQNPIKQIIFFEPKVGSSMRIEVLATGDNSNRASFSELSIITD